MLEEIFQILLGGHFCLLCHSLYSKSYLARKTVEDGKKVGEKGVDVRKDMGNNDVKAGKSVGKEDVKKTKKAIEEA